MSLPASIQSQLDTADAIQKHILGEETPGEAAPAEGTPVVVAPAPTDTPFQDGAPAQTPAAPASEGAWEQRYKTLHGKYEAEVPRLHAELREQRALVSQLNQAVVNLSQQRQQEPEPVRAAASPLVTPQDVETFGTDLVDLIGRKAKEISSGETAALLARIEALQGQVGQNAQSAEAAANASFYTSLGQAVPDYRAINTDPRWLQWLGQVDPLTGSSRQKYLDAASSRRDHARVAVIFNAFKATLQPVEVPETPAQELARQVAPSRSSGGSTPQAHAGDASTRIWTGKDLKTFYTKVRMGEIPVADAQRIETEINRAMAENRIRN